MEHRHLNHHDFTPAAIDDVIARGGRADWAALRDAAGCDPAIREAIRRVCLPRRDEGSAQRYHLWDLYVRQ